MKQITILLILVCGLTLSLASVPPARPVAGKGADSKTLVLYAGTRTAYSLGDALELLQLHLRTISMHIETVSVTNASSNLVASADYVIVFCPEALPALNQAFMETIAACARPVLWVGFGADQLDALPDFPGGFEVSPSPADRAASVVNYRGRSWQAPLFPWLAVSFPSTTGAKTIMAIEEKDAKDRVTQQPLCWQLRNFTFFAGVPLGDAIGFLFGDLLLDFVEARDIPESRLFVRIEDYSAQSNHPEFLRMVDLLYARNIPFMVGVVPSVRGPGTNTVIGLGSAPEFASGLRYAQQRGGRLVLRGSSQPTVSDGAEFWDTQQDRALADLTPEKTAERVQNSVRQMYKHGLFPLAWQTPAYAASRASYAGIAKVFSTGVERVQLSDSTHVEKGVTAGLTTDRHGRVIIPENLGYVVAGYSNSCDQIKAMAEILTHMRGTIGGCYIHAYQPVAKLAELVDALEALKKPYLDLAEMDCSVFLPEKLLLTGQARKSVTLNNTRIRWKAFDKAGKLVREEEDPSPATGERVFRRKGLGDYELIEFTPGNAGEKQ